MTAKRQHYLNTAKSYPIFESLTALFAMRPAWVKFQNPSGNGKGIAKRQRIETARKRSAAELVEQMAEKQCVTEKLKVAEPMIRVGKMNNIQTAAREVVNAELIFA